MFQSEIGSQTLLWLKWLCATHDWKVEIVQAILLPVLELALALEEITGKRSVNEFLRTALSGHDPDDLSVTSSTDSSFVGTSD